MRYRQTRIRACYATADYAPQCRAAPPDAIGCTKFSRCRGCPYPNHGFICWRKDGSCLLTAMNKINEEEIDHEL